MKVARYANFFLKLGKSKGNEVCVYCIPAKPIDQTREVSYHEDVLKQIIEGYGYNVKVVEESIALAYEGLVDDDLTEGCISLYGDMLRLKDSKDALYSTSKPDLIKFKTKMIPYFLWANRGENEMLVWLNEKI